MRYEDYIDMIGDIKEYILKNKHDICTGEAEAILEDIEEIIKSYEEE